MVGCFSRVLHSRPEVAFRVVFCSSVRRVFRPSGVPLILSEPTAGCSPRLRFGPAGCPCHQLSLRAANVAKVQLFWAKLRLPIAAAPLPGRLDIRLFDLFLHCFDSKTERLPPTCIAWGVPFLVRGYHISPKVQYRDGVTRQIRQKLGVFPLKPMLQTNLTDGSNFSDNRPHAVIGTLFALAKVRSRRPIINHINNSMAKNFSYLQTIVAVAVAIVVISFGFMTYQNVSRVRATEQRVARTYEVREAIRELLSTMKDAETGQRGYLITKDEKYLAPYQSALEDVDDEFARLKALTSGDSGQQDRLKRIRALIDTKNAELDSTIGIRRESEDAVGFQRARDVVMTDDGKATMDEIRSLAKTMLASEQELLDEREADSTRRANASRLLILLGNILTLGLILLASYAVRADRKRLSDAEQSIQASQAELSAVLDSASDGIVAIDADHNVMLMNPSANQMFGCSDSDPAGKPFTRFVPASSREAVVDELKTFLRGEESNQLFAQSMCIRADDSEFPVSGRLSRSQLKDSQFVTLMIRDLSEQTARQAKIREQSELLNQVRDAIYVCDMNDEIVYWNRGAEVLYGIPSHDAIGQSAPKLLHATSRGEWREGKRKLKRDGIYTAELQQLDRHSKQLVVAHRRMLLRDDSNQSTGQLIINIDITDRKKEEALQRRSQRLESIGTLAGGIAHDLNNVLTPITMGVKLLARDDGTRRESILKTIGSATERGSHMIKQLLTFAGGEDGMRIKVRIDEVLDEIGGILEHTFPKNVEVEVLSEDDLHSVLGDATELSQVFMNMAINARDAMPDGGKLKISAKNFLVDESRAASNEFLRSGAHVLITVEDNGTGMTPEVIEKAFDPFYTTKEQGKGTGLGLASSIGIIRAHGGDIGLYSELSNGTSFTIYLPKAEVAEGLLVEADADEDIPPGDGECVLIVDDEHLVLEMARATLETHGYVVRGASSGAEALALFQNQSDEIDVVLLDMMMPGMDGVETMKGLSSISGSVSVVASSGLRRPDTEGGQYPQMKAFLAKPYTDEQLLKAIHIALGSS